MATLIRTAEISIIPGGISAVCKHVVNLFNVFRTGVALPVNTDTVILRCEFGGFVADLLAHKEIQCSKSTQGIRLCADCANLADKAHGPKVGEIDLSCGDPTQFLRWTDTELFHMVDLLRDAVGKRSQSQLPALETDCGFNVCPDGIMQDRPIRDIYSLTRHHLRDRMHMLTADGIANAETGLLLHALKQHDISLEMVQTFLRGVHFLACMGKSPRSG